MSTKRKTAPSSPKARAQLSAPRPAPDEIAVLQQQGLARAFRADVPLPDKIVQAATEKALAKFDPQKGKFAHYFSRCLTNQIRTATRRERRRRARFITLTEAIDFADPAAMMASDIVLLDENREALRRAIARGLRHLGKRERKLVWLRHWQELSYAEIVARQEFAAENLTAVAFRLRTSRAYGKLRPLLKGYRAELN